MIWPFTTIATLRRELQDATARVNALHLEIESAAERDQRRVNETSLMERSQKELADALKYELNVTQKALAQAQKNDTAKDTKSGKFAKKAKNV